MAFTFLIIQFMGDTISPIHATLFGRRVHELDIALYSFMGLLNPGVIAMFFIPWLSIKRLLKSLLS